MDNSNFSERPIWAREFIITIRLEIASQGRRNFTPGFRVGRFLIYPDQPGEIKIGTMAWVFSPLKGQCSLPRSPQSRGVALHDHEPDPTGSRAPGPFPTRHAISTWRSVAGTTYRVSTTDQGVSERRSLVRLSGRSRRRGSGRSSPLRRGPRRVRSFPSLPPWPLASSRTCLRGAESSHPR